MKNPIILFNGPPGSGKDTAANLLVREMGAIHIKFVDPMKDALCQLLGQDREWLEDNKDVPMLHGTDATPRALLIQLSEQMIKPILGRAHWARCLSKVIDAREQKAGPQPWVVSDLGLQEEFDYLIEEYGTRANVIWIKRLGHDFSKDSRSYVNPRWADIQNDGSLLLFKARVLEVAATIEAC